MSILFFQAEDGIRDDKVTGVQTCALPISQAAPEARGDRRRGVASAAGSVLRSLAMAIIESVRWSPDGDAVRIIDQTQLPATLVERDLRSIDDVCDAIARLAVRGAPVIGIAGAMGLVCSLVPFAREGREAFGTRLRAYAERIRATRPTAVNLARAIERVLARASEVAGSSSTVLEALRAEATALLEE